MFSGRCPDRRYSSAMTGPPDPFLDAVSGLGVAVLSALGALENAGRRLHPPAIPALRGAVSPALERLEQALEGFRSTKTQEGFEEFAHLLDSAASHAAKALQLFCDSVPQEEAIARVLGAMREGCLSQEALYPLRTAIPALSRFFLEPACYDDVERLDPDPAAQERAGIFMARNEREDRGGFSLYVPESIAEDEARPLIVALHGGFGHGADYLWTWLREARSRRCLLLAPTSLGGTWSLESPAVDATSLCRMVNFVRELWAVDSEHVLLTGLSDGATYTLLAGLHDDMPFTALAPISGVLHPANLAKGNLKRAAGMRIYLVHGALDWMFPVDVARLARDELETAGADLTYREIDDLSHAYPREENLRILEWFDPSLAPAGTTRADSSR